jgi:chromosome segregation ATPase
LNSVTEQHTSSLDTLTESHEQHVSSFNQYTEQTNQRVGSIEEEQAIYGGILGDLTVRVDKHDTDITNIYEALSSIGDAGDQNDDLSELRQQVQQNKENIELHATQISAISEELGLSNQIVTNILNNEFNQEV